MRPSITIAREKHRAKQFCELSPGDLFILARNYYQHEKVYIRNNNNEAHPAFELHHPSNVSFIQPDTIVLLVKSIAVVVED